MKVGFYGHVRQYHSLKAELDAVIGEVLADLILKGEWLKAKSPRG